MPRAGLTTQRVITEAATVADEVGLDRLTLAAVAQRCGVSLPGLYKHVSGLEEVKRGISIATGGIVVYYLLTMVLGLFHIQAPGFGNSVYSIIFSLFVVVIAALGT